MNQALKAPGAAVLLNAHFQGAEDQVGGHRFGCPVHAFQTVETAYG
jgi:hypothetical protein